MTQEKDRSPRPFCYCCFKPREVCICDKIRKVRNRTGIWILQHVRERRHPIGTARIARLALENVRFQIGYYEPPLEPKMPEDVPEDTALLYPSKQATDLGNLGEEEHPANLVVLDGTWRNVRTLYRKHKWLRELPHVRLTPTSPSIYRIRKAPKPDNLSTIEAIAQALQILEPDNPEIDRLQEMFREMIEDQVRYMPPLDNPRYQRVEKDQD